MHYLSTSGNFYDNIIITGEPKVYSFRQVDVETSHFFILTISDSVADHLKFADELITHLRSYQKLDVRACPIVTEDMHLAIRTFMSNKPKCSYFPVYIKSPIPSELIADAQNKIEGVETADGVIPSQDCEWI